MLYLSYDYFDLVNGNPSSMEQRIQSIVDLPKENGVIIFEDGRKCSNEQELRDVLKEKGYIQ